MAQETTLLPCYNICSLHGLGLPGHEGASKNDAIIVTTDIEAQMKQVLSEGLESNAWLIASYPLAEAFACKTLPPVLLLLKK